MYKLILHLTESTAFITKIHTLMLSLTVVKIFRNHKQSIEQNVEFLMLRHIVHLVSIVLSVSNLKIQANECSTIWKTSVLKSEISLNCLRTTPTVLMCRPIRTSLINSIGQTPSRGADNCSCTTGISTLKLISVIMSYYFRRMETAYTE
jgi:hypothetical protein